MSSSEPKTWRDDNLLPFLRRAAIVLGLVALAALVFLLREILLAAFAAVLVAIIIASATKLVSRITHAGHKLSLGIASFLILGTLGLTLFLLWPMVQEQMPALLDRVVQSLGQLEDTLGIRLPDSAQELADSFAGFTDQLWSIVMTAIGTLAGALSGFVLVVAAGLFIAVEPKRYVRGLVLMFPSSWHKRVGEVLNKIGDGLGKWLQAQILAMILVGTLTGIGAWIIGLPSALALGLIAGIGEFVPIIGPFLALLPAALVAFSEGGNLIWWTIGLYILVQQLEGNLITPLLQERMASVPPVFLLFALAGFALMFGIVGIILAAPLTVAVYILVNEIYLKDILHNEKKMRPEKNAETEV